MIISRTDERFWDIRTQQRRLRNGEMSWQDLNSYLSSLKDVSEKAEPVIVFLETEIIPEAS